MISLHTYSTLNIRQKIIKAAQSVRVIETAWKTSTSDFREASLKDIVRFQGWLSKETHPKLKKAAALVLTVMNSVFSGGDISLQARAFNFCYHDLLSLNGTEENEQYFLAGEDLFDAGNGAEVPARFRNAAILDDLRSPFNVGSIFRSADCFGTGELALCGITPRPPHPKLERTAMGTSSWVPWKSFKSAANALKEYKNSGYQIAAVERSSRSVSIIDTELPEKTAFIFGNEEFGITEDILSSADTVIEIPRMGRKNSMNVAGAFAVVMFRFMCTMNGQSPENP